MGDAPHRLPHPLSSNHFRIPSSSVKHFTLTVLIWPSGILVTPQMDTIERYEYRLEQPVDTFLDIFNVQPMPHVVWGIGWTLKMSRKVSTGCSSRYSYRSMVSICGVTKIPLGQKRTVRVKCL